MPKPETWIILSDLHAPFHRVPFIRRVCQAIKHIRPHGIVLAGDFAEIFSLSSYATNSLYQLKGITLDWEYEQANGLLDQITNALPGGAVKQYLWGNHEDRFARYVSAGDNAKLGKALLSPTDGLRLRERGFEVGENWMEDFVTLGDHLHVIHGIYTNQHCAKKHLDEFEASILFGHTHRFQTYISGRRGGWNIGCGCDISNKAFRYMPAVQRRKWRNGFAVVRIDGKGDHFVEPVQAFEDRFVCAGRMY